MQGRVEPVQDLTVKKTGSVSGSNLRKKNRIRNHASDTAKLYLPKRDNLP